MSHHYRGGGGYDRRGPDEYRHKTRDGRQHSDQDPRRGDHGRGRGHHHGGRGGGGPPGGGRGRGGGKYAPFEEFPAGLEHRDVELAINHYTFTPDPNRVFYMYNVVFAADLSKKRQAQVVRIHKDAMMLGGQWVFKNDTIYTTHQIVTGTFSVPNQPLDTITVTLARQMHHDSNDRDQAYNIVMNNILTRAIGLRRIGRWHYDPTKVSGNRELDAFRLKMWPGFMTSVVQTQTGLSWAIDLHHKMVQQDTVLKIYDDLLGGHRSPPSSSARHMFEAAVVKKTVFTIYNNRTYRVVGVDWQQTPAHYFDNRGVQVTYGQYMMTRWNLTLRCSDQPLLLAESRGQTIRLIPELCILTGLDTEQRKNPRIRKAVVQAGQVDPDDRLVRLNELPATINANEWATTTMQHWGISLTAGPSHILGSQLRPEVVYTARPEGSPRGSSMQDLARDQAFDWTRLLFNQLLQPTDIKLWWLLHDERDRGVADRLVHMVRETMHPWGVDPGPPARVIRAPGGWWCRGYQGPGAMHVDGGAGSDGPVFCKALMSEKARGGPKPSLVVVLLPDKGVERYNHVKAYCSLDMGVPSQCVTTAHFKAERGLKSVMTKVCLQMQAKVGGQLWCVKRLHRSIDHMMVVGIDVNHDVPRGTRSVMGFCASLNEDLTQYYSVAAQQEHEHEEIVQQLDVHMGRALDAYYRRNNMYPKSIMVYRDGVSDGELQKVRDEEVEAVLQAISIRQQRHADAQGDRFEPLADQCQLCFFVLKKRITQKLFHIVDHRVHNPSPGTCTEDGRACAQGSFNFYLVSQKTTQGTVSPTHFNLLYHTPTHPLDVWQRRKYHQILAYKLTHLYYNWPGTIRVPAPCQYAHTLAFKVGMHLGGRSPDSPEMAHLLHYL